MPESAYGWSATSRRYFTRSSGRFIPTGRALRALEADLLSLKVVTDRLSDDLRSGRTSLSAFRFAMQDVIKHVQLGAATLAKGGRAQMTPEDYGRVGQLVREQYQFLEDWVQEIAAGTAPLDGRLTSRARSYIPGGKVTYHAIRGADLDAAGYDQERSTTRPAEHCELCLSEEAKGWQPRGQMIPIGRRTCRGNDACLHEFRNSRTGQVMAA